MSAHVLLNLLNKLRKSDKVQGSQSIFSLKFCSYVTKSVNESFYQRKFNVGNHNFEN